MQSFAEFVKNYLNEQNISYSSAAKMCGIDRTILGRYANGSRKPQNKEAVMKLAEGLKMSQEDRKELYEAYRRTTISEKYHTDYATIAAVVNQPTVMINTIKAVSEYEIKEFPEETACNLNTKEEIIDALRYIKEEAAFMKLKFNPSCFAADEEFKNIFTDIRSECPVEQIISLEHFEWQYGEGKMKSLELLLPFLFGSENEQVYYYYQRKSESEKDVFRLNHLITDKGIVFFDQNLTQGFLTNQQVPCSYYDTLFGRMKAKCRIFAEGGAGQYLSFQTQNTDALYEDEEAGIVFYDQKDKNCIWLVKEEWKTAVCINEIEVVQLLRTFIWNCEEDVS